jgi:hypothetical protein
VVANYCGTPADGVESGNVNWMISNEHP